MIIAAANVPTMRASLGDNITTWALLDSQTVHGRGRVLPRLSFLFNARTPRERMAVEIHVMRGQLVVQNEVLGEGLLTGIHLNNHDYQVTLEVPVNRQALEFLDGIAQDRIDVALQLSGWLRGCDDNEDGRRFANQPAPGEWVFQRFGDSVTTLPFQIARSDWFTQVLAPLGTVDYVPVEIAVPRADHPLRQAANHLNEAEQALREGRDPLVFSYCRAAIDALPGAKKEIFDGLPNQREAKALDALLLEAGNYFHLGRHTADDGPQQGEFAVDHGDAAFALNVAKLLIAHTARVLERR